MPFYLIFILIATLFQAPISWADSLSEWMNLEQTRINRVVDETKIYAPDIKNQRLKYRPESQTWFPLKSVWIPESELDAAIDEKNFDPKIKKFFVRTINGKRELRLLIHPESERFYKKILNKYPSENKTFRATSTSSSRTVAVEVIGVKDAKFFAKLSLDVELGGVRRTVPRGEVARSVGTSIYLHDLEGRVGTKHFSHMHEPFGVSPKGWERGGMIVRLIPAEIQNNTRKLVPLFSLYTLDKNGRSLLQELAEKSGLSPKAFTEEHILKHFYKGWVEWNLRGAVTMEAHAQNVLLELDEFDKPTGRFIHRDLGGFNIDMHSPQFKMHSQLPFFSTIKEDYHQEHIASARRQTLYTYFDGGFLYNIDRELQRITPRYREGEILTAGRKILAAELANASGTKPRNPSRFATDEGILKTLNEASQHYNCAAQFQKLAR